MLHNKFLNLNFFRFADILRQIVWKLVWETIHSDVNLNKIWRINKVFLVKGNKIAYTLKKN